MSSSSAHDRLRNQIILVVGGSPYARVWPNETGLVRSYDNAERIFFTGIPGASDILGILCNGIFLAIEVKTGKGKLRQSQINFRAMVEKFGGIFIVGRSTEQVYAAVKEAACKKSSST